MSTLPVLEIKDLSKSFGRVQALSGVSFTLRRGEIHALAGENGAGKSTLMNVIDGILQPDAGEILVDGKPTKISSPALAQRLGIGFVHQEIALCPDVSVAENIFMAATNASTSFLMDFKGLELKAGQVLRQLADLDPTALVRDLSISNQQLVEIAKALTLDCRILILDEPTAALTEAEAQVLFGIMRKLADQGISIIYISHRMVEIFDNCDRVTVFRDGCHVVTHDVADIGPNDVVNAMVGRVIEDLYPEKLGEDGGADRALFQARNLTDGHRFRDVSFDLKQGEILGLAGLIGAGRSEIVKGICRLEGNVSEDRKGDGVFLDLPIAANVSALRVEQVASRLGLINRAAEHDLTKQLGERLNLKCDTFGDPVSSLSGGNQQKVALAKLLSVNPKLVFLDEPTRGVDVGAKAEIHRILRDMARDGVGVVVISSELPELIGLCDRVLVVREGTLSGEVKGDDLTEENIMHLASVTARVTAGE